MPSICLLYGFVMALSGLSTHLCLCYALPAPTVSSRWHPGVAPVGTRCGLCNLLRMQHLRTGLGCKCLRCNELAPDGPCARRSRHSRPRLPCRAWAVARESGRPSEVVLAGWLRKRAAGPLRWVSERLAMGQYNRLTQAVSRMNRRPGQRLQVLQRKQERLPTGEEL